MMQTKFFTCAESASIDAQRNSLSVFHIVEQINASVFPTVFPRIVVCAVLTRNQEDTSTPDLQLTVTSGDTSLINQPIAANFQQRLLLRIVLDIAGLLVPAPVPLVFTLAYQGEQLGIWTVIVNQMDRPDIVVHEEGEAPREANRN